MRGLLVASLALALAGCAAVAPPTEGAADEATDVHAPALLLAGFAPASGVQPALAGQPWPAGVHAVTVEVGGEPATGLLAVPEAAPRAIVVLAHGWGADAAAHREDLVALAADGAVAIAMDYRGERGAFKVRTGVEDTVAATRAVQDAYPAVDLTLLYGWSMGGEVALLAPLRVPAGTYDYVFVGAAVTDLQAFWESYPLAQAAVEEETGGPPTAVPEAYAGRSPVLHAEAFAEAGVQRVVVVHGWADPVVPLDHAERLYHALEAAGQPVSYYVMTRSATVSCVQALCAPEVPGPAAHDAGAFRYLRPFVQHRMDGLPDPAEPALRGTYDGTTGQIEPPDG